MKSSILTEGVVLVNMVTKRLIYFYAWGVIVILLPVVSAVLAWASGDLKSAIVYGIGAALLIVAIPVEVRTHWTPKGASLKFWVIFIRTSCILMLIIGIAALIKALDSSFPLHIILTCVWLVVVGGSGLILRIENELGGGKHTPKS
jgi:hypothetical protein